MNQQSIELLRQLGKQESARLYNGGSVLDFQELQQQAREFANGDKEMEIAAFRCLEHVNDCETNRRTFDKGYRLFSSARYNREIQRLASEAETFKRSRLQKVSELLAAGKVV